MATRTIHVRGDQVQVQTEIGPGRIIQAILVVEDAEAGPSPADISFEQWEKDFDEMLALSPLNPHPVDDSREAIYGPDPEGN